MTKETSVAVIYHCAQNSEKAIRNRPKLQRRLQRAIEDMVEDGFSSFILPIGGRSPFPTIFIDAIIAERSHNPNIRLTILRPHEDEPFTLTAYTQHADEVIYSPKETLLDRSAALIIYHEKYCSQLNHLTHHAHRNRLPLIHINI
ncbi:MAG: hypothetical protein SNI46_04140 [Rikenellaceae bacterium]